MRALLSSLFVIPIVVAQGLAVTATQPRTSSLPKPPTIAGRWQVKFLLVPGTEKNLIFETHPKGIGSFLLRDTGPDDKPVVAPQAAAWSQLTNNRVSFSGEVELPIGTCCREMGTLIFKGKFGSNNSISGKVIFVTSIDEEESAYQFHSLFGTFVATRLP
jgi:hypothetical protein